MHLRNHFLRPEGTHRSGRDPGIRQRDAACPAALQDCTGSHPHDGQADGHLRLSGSRGDFHRLRSDGSVDHGSHRQGTWPEGRRLGGPPDSGQRHLRPCESQPDPEVPPERPGELPVFQGCHLFCPRDGLLRRSGCRFQLPRGLLPAGIREHAPVRAARLERFPPSHGYGLHGQLPAFPGRPVRRVRRTPPLDRARQAPHPAGRDGRYARPLRRHAAGHDRRRERRSLGFSDPPPGQVFHVERKTVFPGTAHFHAAGGVRRRGAAPFLAAGCRGRGNLVQPGRSGHGGLCAGLLRNHRDSGGFCRGA